MTSEKQVPARVDVLVVGGRCAGASLAVQLARTGRSVAVVDRARFPSETVSTHVFQGGGIAALDRLGVLGEVLATGAPPVDRGRVLFTHGTDRLEAEVAMPTDRPDLPAMLCVRRIALDAILHRAAGSAGATLLDGTALTQPIVQNGRVAGAELRGPDGAAHTIHADLVVGADGRQSTLARHVGARAYGVIPTERFGYYAYYRGVPREDPAVVDIVRDERLYGFGIPADDGLYLVCLMAPATDHAAFARDIDAGWEREVAQLPRVGAIVAAAERVGRPRGLRSVDTFFREAAGPGWALVGDAGHFKDPAPGQGIADALRQSERLAAALAGAQGPADLDARTQEWWRWRDRDARDRHAWAQAFGAVGPPPHTLLQALRDGLRRPDGPERFWGPTLQRHPPSDALGPATMARAAARSARHRHAGPATLAREFAAAAGREAGYRRALRTLAPPPAAPAPAATRPKTATAA